MTELTLARIAELREWFGLDDEDRIVDGEGGKLRADELLALLTLAEERLTQQGQIQGTATQETT